MSQVRPGDERHDPEEVIEVAAELAAEDDGRVTTRELREIASDVGIAPREVDRALAEIARRKAVRGQRVRAFWFVAPMVVMTAVFIGLGSAELDAKRRAAAGPPAAVAQPASTTPPIAAPQPAATPAVADPMVSLVPHFAEPPPDPAALAGVRVGLDSFRGKPAAAADILRARGASPREVTTRVTPAILADLDALVLIDARSETFDPAEVDAIERFVRGGGALVIADLGWSWTQYEHRAIDELPVNVLGQRLGFQVTSDVAGLPVAIDPVALPGISGFSRDAWVPCTVLPRGGGGGRPLVRDPHGRPLVLSVAPGQGRVVLFGHMSLPTQNPTMFVQALKNAVRRAL